MQQPISPFQSQLQLLHYCQKSFFQCCFLLLFWIGFFCLCNEVRAGLASCFSLFRLSHSNFVIKRHEDLISCRAVGQGLMQAACPDTSRHHLCVPCKGNMLPACTDREFLHSGTQVLDSVKSGLENLVPAGSQVSAPSLLRATTSWLPSIYCG